MWQKNITSGFNQNEIYLCRLQEVVVRHKKNEKNRIPSTERSQSIWLGEDVRWWKKNMQDSVQHALFSLTFHQYYSFLRTYRLPWTTQRQDIPRNAIHLFLIWWHHHHHFEAVKKREGEEERECETDDGLGGICIRIRDIWNEYVTCVAVVFLQMSSLHAFLSPNRPKPNCLITSKLV